MEKFLLLLDDKKYSDVKKGAFISLKTMLKKVLAIEWTAEPSGQVMPVFFCGRFWDDINFLSATMTMQA